MVHQRWQYGLFFEVAIFGYLVLRIRSPTLPHQERGLWRHCGAIRKQCVLPHRDECNDLWHKAKQLVLAQFLEKLALLTDGNGAANSNLVLQKGAGL